jgi:hypothetical protein
LHEKGGKPHEMLAHHLLETYVDAYVTAAGIGAGKKAGIAVRQHRSDAQNAELKSCVEFLTDFTSPPDSP